MAHFARIVFLLSCATAPSIQAETRVPQDRPNILFIAVDDLRQELGCYGNRIIKSPHIDSIAEHGLVFNRAYCQIAVCMPSRVSVMTGYRPETFAFSGSFNRARQMPEEVTTLPQLFKNHGYKTVSIGKVYHFNDDDPNGWTRRYTDTFYEGQYIHGYCSGYQAEANKKAVATYGKRLTETTDQDYRPPAVEMSVVDDEAYPDGMIAERAIEVLQAAQRDKTPLFLALGFYRPHLPFAVPKRYWDMYDRATIPMPPNPYPVKNGITQNGWDELRRYGDIPKTGNLSEEKTRELIHGYYASVTFTDTQIGKVLAELKRLNLDKDTVILLWGDHGWILGEHNWWCKHISYEIATRTTMMLSVPWLTQGTKTSALVELVDIYPSLCELAHIKAPAYLEGTSFVPLIHEPDQTWKKAVFSEIRKMRAIRTDRYRVIRHPDERYELFDYQADPMENVNVADDPEYKTIREELIQQLNEDQK